MSAFGKYIQDTRVELKHVAWPTQLQTIVYTVLVIGISIVVALYIGFFDFFFSRGLQTFLSKAGASSAPSVITTTPANPIPDFNVTPGVSNSMPVITNESAPKDNTAPVPQVQ